MLTDNIGFGGIMTIDFGSLEKANSVMEMMQHQNIGYLAVSLGFYKTLFSASGTSTSSEISEEERKNMHLSDGLVRFSIGLDHDIKSTFKRMKEVIDIVENEMQTNTSL
jgi:methionine-gamma-lyase